MVTGSDIELPLIGSIGPDSYVWFLLVISLVVIAKAAISLVLQWHATRRFAAFELEIGDRAFVVLQEEAHAPAERARAAVVDADDRELVGDADARLDRGDELEHERAQQKLH